MECSFWEFGAIVRHEKARHDAEMDASSDARRRFEVPAFVASRDSGLDQPADPRARLEAAEDSARAKGWIERSGKLNDQWFEIVSALVFGHSFAYLYLTEPGKAETRAMVTVNHLGFRIVLRGDQVWIDEVSRKAADNALVGCLPDVAPASGRGVTVPTNILAAAGTDAENHKADQGDWVTYELGQAGIRTEDARTVGKLAKLADRVIGQFNVGIREFDGRSHLAPWAIVTHHCPSGRVAQIPQPPRGEQTRVEPGAASVISGALRSYRDELRRQVRDQR
ncbi:ESX secretion-associated protein EspG [Saccharopolyspora spinosa]|uniref:ESX secretion-associated protein EspG n=1 Tax=Saccharopolyspora spinosa TaxID=60894 RepID=UPI000237AAA0|nr:ESX secretion-associated protein EspG [Saccharopolyspora spinosa]